MFLLLISVIVRGMSVLRNTEFGHVLYSLYCVYGCLYLYVAVSRVHTCLMHNRTRLNSCNNKILYLSRGKDLEGNENLL